MKNPHQNSIWWGFLLDYTPMHEVVPRAVNTAEMIDARICSVHLSVSFFVISFNDCPFQKTPKYYN